MNIPKWAKLSAIGVAVAALAAFSTNIQAIAESPLQPFVLKWQVVGILDKLNAIQLQATKKELNDLRSQRLMLRESIERETDVSDKREKMLRLESIEQDIQTGDEDYKVLRCQIEKAAACP